MADNDKIIAPIQLAHKWSNWASQKQLAVRWCAEYGDWFAKACTNRKIVEMPNANGQPITQNAVTRVYIQNIRPEYVPLGGFREDERGNIIHMRIEIPKVKWNGSQLLRYLHCEVWDKEDGTYKRYELPDTEVAHDLRRTTPAETIPLADFGIDFVPFVHAKFQDIGEDTGNQKGRGVGCFVHALDKIDEVNRKATRLAQLMYRYNKATWAITGIGNDPDGRPLPAVSLDGEASDGSGGVAVDVADDGDYKTFPGNSTMTSLVPSVDYGSYLDAVDQDMKEIEQDLPELKYFRVDTNAPSGKAIRLLLGDAIDRAIEMRGNMETALSRLDEMLLTMGQNANLPGFGSLGSFDAGDFAHTFAERDVIAISQQERDEETRLFWAGWGPLEANGVTPFAVYAASMGWSQKRINDALVAMGKQVLDNKTSGGL